MSKRVDPDLGVIHVERRIDPFVQVDKGTIQDVRLSFKARGLLAYILSLPPGWTVRVAHLMRQGIEGREAIRGAFKELEGLGYAKRTEVRKADGTYAWVTKIFETPGLNEDFAASQVATGDGKPSPDRIADLGQVSTTGEPSPVSRPLSKKENQDETREEEPAPSGAEVSPGKVLSPDRQAAEEAVKEFWEESSPKPVINGGYIALVKMVERFIEAGFTPKQMHWALRHTRAFTIDAITFTIRTAIEEKARTEGPGRHLQANLEALEILRSRRPEIGS